jgi:hypothetical protein
VSGRRAVRFWLSAEPADAVALPCRASQLAGGQHEAEDPWEAARLRELPAVELPRTDFLAVVDCRLPAAVASLNPGAAAKTTPEQPAQEHTGLTAARQLVGRCTATTPLGLAV